MSHLVQHPSIMRPWYTRIESLLSLYIQRNTGANLQMSKKLNLAATKWICWNKKAVFFTLFLFYCKINFSETVVLAINALIILWRLVLGEANKWCLDSSLFMETIWNRFVFNEKTLGVARYLVIIPQLNLNEKDLKGDTCFFLLITGVV